MRLAARWRRAAPDPYAAVPPEKRRSQTRPTRGGAHARFCCRCCHRCGQPETRPARRRPPCAFLLPPLLPPLWPAGRHAPHGGAALPHGPQPQGIARASVATPVSQAATSTRPPEKRHTRRTRSVAPPCGAGGSNAKPPVRRAPGVFIFIVWQNRARPRPAVCRPRLRPKVRAPFRHRRAGCGAWFSGSRPPTACRWRRRCHPHPGRSAHRG